MKHVLAIFNEKNVAALKSKYPDEEGLIEFLSTVLQWWNTVNVKTKFKGVCKRLSSAFPIYDAECENINFLLKFVSQLDAWESLSDKGKLTKQTHQALRHTTATLVEISKYLLKTDEFSYILLGKFQTDNLEDRFGLYRRLSGCAYNLSVQQILESEKKLKIMRCLTLKSASMGEISVKDITNFEKEGEDQFCSTQESVNEFSISQDDLEDSHISSEDAIILVYIAGYVAFATKKKLKCDLCASRLCSSQELEVETNQNIFDLMIFF